MNKLIQLIGICIVTFWVTAITATNYEGTTECRGYTSTTSRFPCDVYPYDSGNCTWWAAYKRSDLAAAGIHGNGGQWYENAKDLGFEVGSEPRDGAVAVFSDSPYGHVAYVEHRGSDGSFSVSEMDAIGSFGNDGVNYATYSPNGDGTYNRNGYGFWVLSGFIYGRESESDALPIRCSFGYCWRPSSKSDKCEDGTHHMAMTEHIVIMNPVDKSVACSGALAYCYSTASGLLLNTNPAATYQFWFSEFTGNPRNDVSLWDLFGVCDQQRVLSVSTAREMGGGSYELVTPLELRDLSGYPSVGASLPILNPEPLVFPDIRIWSIGVFDGSQELNEQENHIEPGGTYRINVYPVSEIANAENGTDPDIEHVETDVFVGYALSEADVDWKFLCRNYTRVENLTKDSPHKESCDVTVPDDMGGQRLYMKAKGDATGEVEEDDEGNNWSDEFKEWFPIKGECNLVISWAGLDEGKDFLLELDNYGLRAGVKNIGTTPCPGKSRITYELREPGGSFVEVAQDGVDSDQLMPGDVQWEHTMYEPFTAEKVGVYDVRVCADSNGRNSETDESDNCLVASFEVRSSRSDLAVADLYLKVDGATVRDGGSIWEDSTVYPYCVVRNQGNRDARNGTRLAYYVDSGNYRGDDGLDAADLTLGSNKTEYMSTGFRLGDTGSRSFRCCADYQGSEPELNESNNCRTMGFTVKPKKPDFVVYDLYVVYDGNVVRNGGTGKEDRRYRPHCKVKNVGNANSPSGIRIKYYINADKYRDGDGIDANQLTVGRVQHEYVGNDDIKLGDGGWRTYRCCVDTGNQVSELNEGNNCRTMSFYLK